MINKLTKISVNSSHVSTGKHVILIGKYQYHFDIEQNIFCFNLTNVCCEPFNFICSPTNWNPC